MKSSGPSWPVSLLPLAVLVAILFFVIRFFGADALAGGSQVALLFSTGVVIALAMLVYHIPWKSIEEAIATNTRSIGPAVLILLLIGAIAGSWMVSGIVPTLIFYGLKILSPKIFLLAVCLICAIVSVMTGSSWTTIATIGVAFIGIGVALGFPVGWTAGAIISGAYFGDKVSPLSDTTVLASSVTETPLFTHIRYMMVTTIPSFCIALIIFLIVSLCHGRVDSAQIAGANDVLRNTFNISPWLLLVPVLTGIMIVKKVPAFLTLLASSAMAGITALIAQPQVVQAVSGMEGAMTAISGFKGLMITYFGETGIETGNAIYNDLGATGGMNGMLPTIFLIVCAATFGGLLNGSGMIQSITEMLTRKIS